MANTPHGIYWPEDYETHADLPIIMEDNALSIEAALVAMEASVAAGVAAGPPLGAILAFGGTTAPTGWHLCDGSAHGSTALEAVLGSPNTPDLRGRFVVGAGPGYAPKATGGQESVILTGGQSGVAPHAHGASAAPTATDHTHSIPAQTVNSGNDSPDHSHSANPGAVNTSSNTHNHTLSIREGTGDGDGYYLDTNPTDSGATKTLSGSSTSSYSHTHSVDLPTITTGGASARHQHSVTTPATTSGGQSASHAHAVTVDQATAAPATVPHENRPPYYALVFIIRKA